MVRSSHPWRACLPHSMPSCSCKAESKSLCMSPNRQSHSAPWLQGQLTCQQFPNALSRPNLPSHLYAKTSNCLLTMSIQTPHKHYKFSVESPIYSLPLHTLLLCHCFQYKLMTSFPSSITQTSLCGCLTGLPKGVKNSCLFMLSLCHISQWYRQSGHH